MGFGLGEDFDEMIRNNAKTGMNSDAKKFYHLMTEGKQPLYPGSIKFTSLSFIIKLYGLKCTHGFSESAFSGILELIKEAFPDVNLPPSFNKAKNMIRELGLDYQKIHVCPNDCMLYWAENENETNCKVCGVSRWKTPQTGGPNSIEKIKESTHKIPAKVMRYFPLKPRLQHLFMYNCLLIVHLK